MTACRCQLHIIFTGINAASLPPSGPQVSPTRLQTALTRACAATVAPEVLEANSIYQIETSNRGSDMTLLVVRHRRSDRPQTAAERSAVQLACGTLNRHHGTQLTHLLLHYLSLYRNELAEIRARWVRGPGARLLGAGFEGNPAMGTCKVFVAIALIRRSKWYPIFSQRASVLLNRVEASLTKHWVPLLRRIKAMCNNDFQ